MGFWLLLLLFAATTVVSALLQKHPTNVKPSALGDFTAPTAQEGRAIPVIFGTVWLQAPNVTWYGDLASIAIKRSGGLFGMMGSQVVGYKYYLGMQHAICHGPVDELVDIRMGNRSFKNQPTDWFKNGSQGSGWWSTLQPAVPLHRPDSGKALLNFNWPQAFGGEQSEGGVFGTGAFYFGTDNQQADAYFAQQIGVDTAPAYQGLCYMMNYHCYMGTSQYLKEWTFVLRRCPNTLGVPQFSNIGGDANPAEIIYEALTNLIWGLGEPSTRIDLGSFQGAAQRLFNEGMGMSVQWDSPNSADALVQDILRHIDGVLYTDPSSGLITLKLARADYDSSTLLEFGPADWLDKPEFSIGSWEETLNDLKVIYLSRAANFTERSAQAQELANFMVTGERKSDQLEFKGFTNAALAQQIVMRELKTHSTPIAQVKVSLNRRGWPLRMCGVFKLTIPNTRLQASVMRITSIDYGALEDGKILVECVEDVFATAYAAYKTPAATAWQNPADARAAAPAAQLLQELPYALTAAGERKVLCAAVRSDSTSTGFQVWSDEGTGLYNSGQDVQRMCPSGVLQAAYDMATPALDPTGFVLTGCKDLVDLESTDSSGIFAGVNLAVIVDGAQTEWISWGNITPLLNGDYAISNVLRAAYDTVPSTHASGCRVYFITEGAGLTRDVPYAADLNVGVKLLPFNFKGPVPDEQVSEMHLQTISRAQLPYPCGNLRINGLLWPSVAVPFSGDVAITWATRNRLAQSKTQLLAHDAGDQGTAEGQYTCTVWIGGAQVRTLGSTSDPGASFVYMMDQRRADNANLALPVVVKVTPTNGPLTGPTRSSSPFLMGGGFGQGFGYNFGGN